MNQLSFKIKGGDYSDDLIEEAKYQTALAASGWLHRFTAWIWDGNGLKVKDASGDESDDCHFSLFGNVIYRCPFRGWFNPEKKVIAFMCNAQMGQHVRGGDEMPERVYRHLLGRFGKDCRFVFP